MSAAGRELIVAPFSNCEIRDWPIGHYTALIGLLLRRLGPAQRITVIGTANQKLRANEIVRPYPADRVDNACGRLGWAAVTGRLAAARCVVGNNSGVAHLSAVCGTPTVCVFGGSQSRLEWHPRGPNVIIITRTIGCSPCMLDHGRTSPYDRACLRQIEPELVADAVAGLVGRAERGTAMSQVDDGVALVRGTG